MGVSAKHVAGTAFFEPVIQFDMDIKAFLSAWFHCDHIATYLARMISHNRSDSVRHSNLFSSAFNELLEVTFRTRHSGGDLACKVSRKGATDRIELTFPCTQDERQFYESVVSHAADPDTQERYLSSVSGDVAPSREVVLLELAVNYNATLQLGQADADMITLLVDLSLEEMPH
jgi:hypothetical protein